MISDHELQRLKHLRAEANEITDKLAPESAVSCSECGCKLLYAKDDGQLYCVGCNAELSGNVELD